MLNVKISLFWYVKLCSLAKIHRHYEKKMKKKQMSPKSWEVYIRIYGVTFKKTIESDFVFRRL